MHIRSPQWVTPNRLTLLRVAAAPVLVGLLYVDRPATNFAALAVFLLAAVTDFVDGELARARNEITSLGKLLDPLADKVLVAGALVMLTASGHAGGIPTALILMREFAVTGLRQAMVLDGTVLAAVSLAKWKTGLQIVAIALLMLNHDPFGLPLEAAGRLVLWAAAIVALWSAYDYFAAYFDARRHRNEP